MWNDSENFKRDEKKWLLRAKLDGVNEKRSIIDRNLEKERFLIDENGRKMDINLYHKISGHLHERYMRRRAASEGISLTGKLKLCDNCVMGKARKKPIAKISSYKQATRFGGRVFTDMSGPFKVRGYGGVRYMFTFVDDYSRKKWTYLMREKSDVLRVL